ncbi:MAG: hypothetical protein JRH20_18015 [Deltaproteobacteria bacterium]|nr:hypothetical protein [Deltaproteobacteria bacterium]
MAEEQSVTGEDTLERRATTGSAEHNAPVIEEGTETTPPAGVRPSRYRRVSTEMSDYLVCADVPHVHLQIERGLVVEELGRKKYPRQTVFLDGVFSGAPFLDNEARQYSLDHHAGCVRPFTLATCEQAAVMLLQGLPLETGEWKLHINDPDLDAVLAAWLLLNHVELRHDPALFRAVMPFVRVEGVIDAHGLDRSLLAGLPAGDYERQKARIDILMGEERRIKAEHRWQEIDLLDYTHDLLGRLDEQLYPARYLSDLQEISEIAQVPLAGERLAVLCRSQQGIYAVETHLKKRYEKNLAVIVLEQSPKTVTLRQTDPFLPKNLEAVYEQLNKRDPATQANPDHKWGGSAEIGGSPREGGTDLPPEDILRVVQAAYTGGWLRRMMRKITSIGG